MEWWEIAKQLREALPMGQTEFGRSLKPKLSPQRITDMEAGRYPNPSLRTLRRLAKGLNTSVAVLIGEVEPNANKIYTRDLLRPATVLQLSGSLPTKEGAHNDADLAVAVPGLDRLREELQHLQGRILITLADLDAVAPRQHETKDKTDTAGDS